VITILIVLLVAHVVMIVLLGIRQIKLERWWRRVR